MAHCEVCDSDVPDPEILEHLRLLHPDEYGDGPELWPDGGVVIHVEPEPEDFDG